MRSWQKAVQGCNQHMIKKPEKMPRNAKSQQKFKVKADHKDVIELTIYFNTIYIPF